MKKGIDLIFEERIGHYTREGWTDERDDQYTKGELADAATCYVMPVALRSYISFTSMVPTIWPWSKDWWKPSPDDRIRELAKAGALIAAEIDRLQRLKEKDGN